MSNEAGIAISSFYYELLKHAQVVANYKAIATGDGTSFGQQPIPQGPFSHRIITEFLAKLRFCSDVASFKFGLECLQAACDTYSDFLSIHTAEVIGVLTHLLLAPCHEVNGAVLDSVDHISKPEANRHSLLIGGLVTSLVVFVEESLWEFGVAKYISLQPSTRTTGHASLPTSGKREVGEGSNDPLATIPDSFVVNPNSVTPGADRLAQLLNLSSALRLIRRLLVNIKHQFIPLMHDVVRPLVVISRLSFSPQLSAEERSVCEHLVQLGFVCLTQLCCPEHGASPTNRFDTLMIIICHQSRAAVSAPRRSIAEVLIRYGVYHTLVDSLSVPFGETTHSDALILLSELTKAVPEIVQALLSESSIVRRVLAFIQAKENTFTSAWKFANAHLAWKFANAHLDLLVALLDLPDVGDIVEEMLRASSLHGLLDSPPLVLRPPFPPKQILLLKIFYRMNDQQLSRYFHSEAIRWCSLFLDQQLQPLSRVYVQGSMRIATAHQLEGAQYLAMSVIRRALSIGAQDLAFHYDKVQQLQVLAPSTPFDGGVSAFAIASETKVDEPAICSKPANASATTAASVRDHHVHVLSSKQNRSVQEVSPPINASATALALELDGGAHARSRSARLRRSPSLKDGGDVGKYRDLSSPQVASGMAQALVSEALRPLRPLMDPQRADIVLASRFAVNRMNQQNTYFSEMHKAGVFPMLLHNVRAHQPVQEKTFLMGLHGAAGAKSAINCSFLQSPLFDPCCLNILFEFVNPALAIMRRVLRRYCPFEYGKLIQAQLLSTGSLKEMLQLYHQDCTEIRSALDVRAGIGNDPWPSPLLLKLEMEQSTALPLRID